MLKSILRYLIGADTLLVDLHQDCVRKGIALPYVTKEQAENYCTRAQQRAG